MLGVKLAQSKAVVREVRVVMRHCEQFGRTTDVEPYPVQLGSRYHDGNPDEPGKSWWGTVTGFQPSEGATIPEGLGIGDKNGRLYGEW